MSNWAAAYPYLNNRVRAATWKLSRALFYSRRDELNNTSMTLARMEDPFPALCWNWKSPTAGFELKIVALHKIIKSLR